VHYLPMFSSGSYEHSIIRLFPFLGLLDLLNENERQFSSV
jgi:hypothetical protein